MSEKINLEQIFDNNFDCYTQAINNWKQFEEPAISKDKFKEVCLEFGKQLLALAAKNAKIENVNTGKCKQTHSLEDGLHFTIHKQSILNTINQIK
jgi:hypothetical protein